METLTIGNQPHNGSIIIQNSNHNKNSSLNLISDLEFLQSRLTAIKADGVQAFNPQIPEGEGEYEKFVREKKLNHAERLLVLLALIPHIDAEVYEVLIDARNSFHVFEVPGQRQLLPSGRTFIKLYAGSSIILKLEAQRYLNTDHILFKQGVLQLGAVAQGAVPESGPLNIGPAYKDMFLFNHQGSPRFSDEFPAQLLETTLEWNDLIVSEFVAQGLEEICNGAELKVNPQSEPVLARHERPGYRALFHGPSGTGKTEAVALIGRRLGRKVYRVNLSSVMSKYVGQTIKNLESLFNTSEHRGWILFFDEGDALFGKRTTGEHSEESSAQHNNRDVAFLLQRIERFTGIIFVATNLSKNIDDAFSRRFEVAINFGALPAQLYEKVWLNNLPKQFTLDPNIDFKYLHSNYPFTPGSIINVIKRLWKRMSLRGETHVKQAELIVLMKDELNK